MTSRPLSSMALALALGILPGLFACGGSASTAPSPPPTPTPDPDPLRADAATAGRLIGAAVQSTLLGEAAYSRTLSFFLQKLGESYLELAFRVAREADPDVLLIYNDYGAEGLGRKSDDVYALLRRHKERGAPIGGVGLQMHVAAQSRPPSGDIAANMRRLADLGLLVNISEMDVRIKDVAGDKAARLQVQRREYQDLVAVCLNEPFCHAVTFWGFTDKHSWIDGFFGPDDPLLFDEAYAAKPAFFGVQDALRRR